MATKRRTAAEIIAFHFGSDIRDIQDARYQPSRYPVAIYTVGDDYYCAPNANQKLPAPAEFNWQKIGEHYGRTVYRSVVNATSAES